MPMEMAHKCLAGMSQASQIHVRDAHIAGQRRHTGHDRFNETFMMHTSTSPQYNMIASLDDLENLAPSLGAVSLVAGWFGDDLRAGHCTVKPGVEIADKTTYPQAWSVNGVARSDAHLVTPIARQRRFRSLHHLVGHGVDGARQAAQEAGDVTIAGVDVGRDLLEEQHEQALEADQPGERRPRGRLPAGYLRPPPPLRGPTQHCRNLR